jgi:CubicO group peptidase (beta-lactamase class C family)
MKLYPFAGTICVIKSGEIIFNQAYGMACIEFNVPNGTDTRFSLASISKQFTAFAMMQLYEEARIDIDKPVNDAVVCLRIACTEEQDFNMTVLI